jgi:hypothetical protein
LGGRQNLFFFEKTNQKTFANCLRHPTEMGKRGATRNSQKFFGSFFQKRTSSSSACARFAHPSDFAETRRQMAAANTTGSC